MTRRPAAETPPGPGRKGRHVVERTKRPGRPTDYRPEFCEAVIACARQGGTFDGFADSVNVARSTLYQWNKVHPEFSDAMGRARSALAARLHREAMAMTSAPAIAYRLKLLANVAPEDFRKRGVVDHGGIRSAPSAMAARASY